MKRILGDYFFYIKLFIHVYLHIYAGPRGRTFAIGRFNTEFRIHAEKIYVIPLPFIEKLYKYTDFIVTMTLKRDFLSNSVNLLKF